MSEDTIDSRTNGKAPEAAPKRARKGTKKAKATEKAANKAEVIALLKRAKRGNFGRDHHRDGLAGPYGARVCQHSG